MDRVRQSLSFLIVMLAGACFLSWAGWFNENLDFVDLARYAYKFPLGPDKGPLAFGFGGLFVAWIVYPTPEDRDRRYEASRPPPGRRR
jgi:hypothetical protein